MAPPMTGSSRSKWQTSVAWPPSAPRFEHSLALRVSNGFPSDSFSIVAVHRNRRGVNFILLGTAQDASGSALHLDRSNHH